MSHVTNLTPDWVSNLPIHCAILHVFDTEALQSIAGFDQWAADVLLTSQAVQPITPNVARYQFVPTIRANLLNRLRRECPRDEPALHQRAFEYYLQRMLGRDGALVLFDESAALHHLRMLRELNLDYMRWDEIDSMIAQLRALPTLQQEHADELTLYTAANTMRAQQYEESKTLMLQLLARPDLAPDLRAATHNSLGILAMIQGHLEQAIAYFERPLNTPEPINPSHIGGALVNLSWVYHQMNQFDTALDLARRSLEYFRSNGDLYGEAYALYTIGNNALYLGLLTLAQEQLDQAASIYTMAGMDARSAMVNWARGMLYQILGDHTQSEEAYLYALQIAESSGTSNLITARDTLELLSLLYQTQGRLDQAATLCMRAITLGERIGDEHRLAQTRHRLSSIQLQQGQFDPAFSGLSAAISAIEQIRAATEGEQIKLGLLSTVQQIYETTVLACLQHDDVAGAFEYVERARARAFLDLLARRDAALVSALAEHPATLADTQALLDHETVLLEYYTIGVLPPGNHFLRQIPETNAHLRELLLLKPEIIVFAITREQAFVHRIDFDPNLLQPLPGDPASGRHLLTERKLTWLHHLLIEPIHEQITQKRLVYIIPHGPLHYVPFAALRSPSGATLLASDGPALAYAPSATVLRTCLERRRGNGTINTAIGYNGSGSTALQLAEYEAEQIGLLTGGHVYTGTPAKTALLFEQAPHIRCLHITGHAVFLPNDPLGSYLLLGTQDRLDAQTIIQKLQLAVDLVTLNACTSGLSHVVAGDELLGLPRAFLFAGAPTIVCTLAEVDDLASYILMVMFYENLAFGQKPAAALHAAQNTLRTMTQADLSERMSRGNAPQAAREHAARDSGHTYPFAHPRYWASFMLIGRP